MESSIVYVFLLVSFILVVYAIVPIKKLDRNFHYIKKSFGYSMNCMRKKICRKVTMKNRTKYICINLTGINCKSVD